MSKLDEEKEEHESFGLVSFTRTTGNPGRLFGSPLRNHESYVTLRVSKAVRLNSHGQDRYYGSHRGDVVEVSMSAAQFAELLTTMNVGLGVPCTINYVGGKRLEKPPEDMELEVEKVRRTYGRDLQELVKKVREGRPEMEKILEKKSLTVADKKALQEFMGLIERHATDNAPFMLSQFEEATETVVKHAKAEIDSFVTANVVQQGLAAIAAGREKGQEPPGLPEPAATIERASDRLRGHLKKDGIADISIGIQAFTKTIVVYTASKGDSARIPPQWEGYEVKAIVSGKPSTA